MSIVALFFITALLYASIGFGGGSTYNALLIIGGVDYRLLPVIALICNIIVVAGGCLRFYKANSLPVRRLLPWMIFSIPAAWIGGSLSVSEVLFTGLLGMMLALSAIYMVIEGYGISTARTDWEARTIPFYIPAIGGGLLGLLAGITGIGGGIFLAPVMHIMKIDRPRQIAAMCSLFILFNSLSGLMGQMVKLQKMEYGIDFIAEYFPLFLAVFLGGQIGSFLANKKLQSRLIKIATAVLIAYVAGRLLWQFTKSVLAV